MIFHLKEAQNLIAKHYERDFDMIFHFNAAKNQAHIQGGGIWGTCPPLLEPNAQRKNLWRLKDLRGQIQQKSPKFSK